MASNHTSKKRLRAVNAFGGFKNSGVGREGRLEELLSYTEETDILVMIKNGRTGVRQSDHGTGAHQQLPAAFARGLIKVYRYTISPLLGPNCRHLPGCSEYAEEAFGRFGFWAGGWMTLARLLRCQPWGTSGLDFVPHELRPGARWWLPWRYGLWRGTNAGPPPDGTS